MCEKLITTEDAELWLSGLPRTSYIDLQAVFPAFHRSELTSLKAIILFQRSDMDFMQELQGYEAKDRLLERFFRVAEEICGRLEGSWVDYIDPSTGLPMKSTQGPGVWNDVDMIQRMMKMPVVAVGGCQLLLHPTYGAKCYPGVILTTAETEFIRLACHCLSFSPSI